VEFELYVDCAGPGKLSSEAMCDNDMTCVSITSSHAVPPLAQFGFFHISAIHKYHLWVILVSSFKSDKLQ